MDTTPLSLDRGLQSSQLCMIFSDKAEKAIMWKIEKLTCLSQEKFQGNAGVSPVKLSWSLRVELSSTSEEMRI